MTYGVGDSSIANVTALREHELVEDIGGIHFVRVPVNIQLRNRVPVGPGVSVRWAEAVTPAERSRLEERFQLLYGEVDREDPRKPTWEYELGERSDANVTTLANNPQVASIDQVDRGETPGTFKARPWTAPKGGNVSVVWKGGLTDADRRVLEQRYHLEPDDSLPDGMVAYALTDASPDAIRTLMADPHVVDVSGIDKERLRPVGTTWFSALRREHSVLRIAFMPRLFLKENAGVWLYWICVLLPFVVFALLLVDVRTGRGAGIVSGEAQKMFAAAALMAVANYALMRRLETFADHVDGADGAAILGAWLLARAFAVRHGLFSRVGIRLATTGMVAVTIMAAAIYVNAPTLISRLGLTLPPAQQWALHVDKFRSLSVSPPVDFFAPPDSNGDRAVFRYMYECTRPDDRIFVTSDSYAVPYYTQRRVVGHVFWAAGLTANPDFERRMIELMERDPVPLVFGVGGERPLDNLDKYPLVQAYVDQRYTERHAILQDHLAGRVLWLMMDSRRAPSGTYPRLGLPCFA